MFWQSRSMTLRSVPGPKAVYRGSSFRADQGFTKQLRQSKVPAHRFCIEVPGLPVIDHNYFMMLVQKALKGRFWSASNVAPVASPVTGPPEAVTLTILLGKD